MLRVFFMLDCDECHQAFERVAASRETTDELKIEAWLQAAGKITYWAERSGWEFYPCAQVCDRCCRQNEQPLLTQTDTFDPDFLI